MKKLLTTLLVLALVAWLGFKAAVWYLADERLAQAREGLSDMGVLVRGEIGSSVAGELSLRNSHFQPFRLTQGLEIDVVQLNTPSPLALLQFLVSPAEVPRQWTLEADGLGMTLDPAMTKNWVTKDPDAPPALFALVCGPDERQMLGSGDLIRMGIDRVSGDLLLRQDPEGLHAELNTSAMGSLELDWPGARLDPTRPGALAETSDQPLRLILRDGGLMRKVSAYCARETGMPIDTWAGTAAADFGAALTARGLAPSPQLMALYGRWLTEGGRLEFALRPTAPALGIPVLGPDAAQTEELALSYNESRVPDIYLREIDGETAPATAQAGEAQAPVLEPEAPAWRETPVTEAFRWLERQVRVTLNTGRVVEGRLTNVTDSRLEVTRVMDGGEVAYPVAVGGVTGFEVWRRAGDPGRTVPPVQPESSSAAEPVPAEDTGTDAPGEPEN